jgi:hypothetical protein
MDEKQLGNHIGWLKGELGMWIREGIIDKEQAGKIRSV